MFGSSQLPKAGKLVKGRNERWEEAEAPPAPAGRTSGRVLPERFGSKLSRCAAVPRLFAWVCGKVFTQRVITALQQETATGFAKPGFCCPLRLLSAVPPDGNLLLFFFVLQSSRVPPPKSDDFIRFSKGLATALKLLLKASAVSSSADTKQRAARSAVTACAERLPESQRTSVFLCHRPRLLLQKQQRSALVQFLLSQAVTA